MKLRIRGNSIRLRLTQGEVERLHAGGSVEEFVDFGHGNERLTYLIASDESVSRIRVDFEGGLLAVRVPGEAVRRWAVSNDVGLEKHENGLQILVEKDFACLKQRPGEDETDMFPNPAGSAR